MTEIMAVSGDTLHAELESAERILAKWREAVGKGIPGVDMPASEEVHVRFVTELCGELLIVAGKCQTVAAVVADRA